MTTLRTLRILSKAEWPTWAVESYGDLENMRLVLVEVAGQDDRIVPMANWEENEVLPYVHAYLDRLESS